MSTIEIDFKDNPALQKKLGSLKISDTGEVTLSFVVTSITEAGIKGTIKAVESEKEEMEEVEPDSPVMAVVRSRRNAKSKAT